MKKLVLLLILIFSLDGYAAHLHKEKEYQNAWCSKQDGGVTEYVLDDKARVDCLTKEYAVEVDFASKWAEAVGQALYYAAKTNKRPGILLILETKGEQRYLKRLKIVSKKYLIRVWIITPEDLK